MSADQLENGDCGSVTSIWRYPVKSMIGQELESCAVSEAGLVGDRAYALIDGSDGKVVSAKNPRKWGGILACHAAFAEPPHHGTHLPTVKITDPDGTVVSSGDEGADAALSRMLGRTVWLKRRGGGPEDAEALRGWAPTLEEYWPEDIDGLAHSGVVTDEAMPPGSFFDLAPVHVLTTATLRRLGEIHAAGDYDLRRFRPNIVIASPEGLADFAENAWIGGTVQIGQEVELRITGPCPRCVMTTVAQGSLPRDVGVLRAAAAFNAANVGVYATVVRAGLVRTGDRAVLR
jgi:uncharacterized protein